MSQIARAARKAFTSPVRFASTVNVEQAAAIQKKATQVAQGYVDKVTAYSKPVIYQAKVAAELAKQVYQKEGLAFPSPSQAENALATIRQNATVENIKQLDLYSIARIGLYGLEAYFIFVIGEIIGRRHLVGYGVKSSVKKEHH